MAEDTTHNDVTNTETTTNPAADSASTEKKDSRLKVLLVDDDSFLLELYAMKFKKNDYDVTSLTSAETALERLEEGYTPDVIVTDIIMPKVDGLDFLKAMQDRKLSADAVKVVLSNQGAPSDIRAAQAVGAHGYIIKATTIPSEVVIEVKKVYQEIKGQHKAS